MSLPLVFRLVAQKELDEAAVWYECQKPGLGEAYHFINSIGKEKVMDPTMKNLGLDWLSSQERAALALELWESLGNTWPPGKLMTEQPTELSPPDAQLAGNPGMLQVLNEIEELWKGMEPKKDQKDYLREARAGAMYGFGDDD